MVTRFIFTILSLGIVGCSTNLDRDTAARWIERELAKEPARDFVWIDNGIYAYEHFEFHNCELLSGIPTLLKVLSDKKLLNVHGAIDWSMTPLSLTTGGELAFKKPIPLYTLGLNKVTGILLKDGENTALVTYSLKATNVSDVYEMIAPYIIDLKGGILGADSVRELSMSFAKFDDGWRPVDLGTLIRQL